MRKADSYIEKNTHEISRKVARGGVFYLAFERLELKNNSHCGARGSLPVVAFTVLEECANW